MLKVYDKYIVNVKVYTAFIIVVNLKMCICYHCTLFKKVNIFFQMFLMFHYPQSRTPSEKAYKLKMDIRYAYAVCSMHHVCIIMQGHWELVENYNYLGRM